MAVRRIERDQEQRSNPWPWIALIACAVAFAWLWIRTEDAATLPTIAAPDPQGTMAVNVNVTLLESTATATAIPTVKPTDAPTMDLHADDCSRSNPEPGETCRRDPLPTNTPQPLAECPAAMPGDLCIWTDPLTSGRPEAE